jgi:hypothetical protein
LTGEEFGNYIIENRISLILSIVLGIIFLIAPFLITRTRKDNSQSPIQNHSPIVEVKILLQQILINIHTQTNTTVISPKPTPTKNDNASDNTLLYWGLGSITGVLIYQKYHSEIMNFLTYYTLIALLSTLLLVILLYRSNILDRLSQLWCGTMLYLVIINFINIALMSRQEILGEGDVSLLLKVLYYLEGFVFIAFINVALLIIQIHLFALNIFISRPGKVSGFIVRKTRFLLNRPVGNVVFIVILSLLSLLLSSGYAFELVSK